MRRAINTISKEEYNHLLAEAAQRMRAKIGRLIDEECSSMRMFDHLENYGEAERRDFNQRALELAIKALYLTEKKSGEVVGGRPVKLQIEYEEVKI